MCGRFARTSSVETFAKLFHAHAIPGLSVDAGILPIHASRSGRMRRFLDIITPRAGTVYAGTVQAFNPVLMEIYPLAWGVHRPRNELARRMLVKDIVWSYVFSVGVDEIDEDHRKLVNIFNILNQSVTQRESPEYLAAVLEELINCTVWHFSHEERLMLKYGYADIVAHKEEHRELIKSAKALQQALLQADRPVAETDIEILERWLTEHILTDDMRLGAWLSQEM